MSILVTGGLGYIGSHTVVELINSGEEVIIFSKLTDNNIEVYNNLIKITGTKPILYEGNLLNLEDVKKVFEEYDIKEVIHLASTKNTSDLFDFPLYQYKNNVISTINLLEIMNLYNCKKIVFSSTAMVMDYNSKCVNIEEECMNTYKTSKMFIERLLKDVHIVDNEWSIGILRYYNVLGAHESALIGEWNKEKPSNIMSYILNVASGKLDKINIFGNDYPTKDGTCLRDYIHVVDVALANLQAIYKIRNYNGISVYEIGSGKGYTILELIKKFEDVNNVKINYSIVQKREGDIGISVANIDKAKEELNWKPTMSIEKMCEDSWNFVKNKLNTNKNL